MRLLSLRLSWGALLALALLAAPGCGEPEELCEPACEGRLCGPDGCGGFCGICDTGSCVNGACSAACSCAGRECGDDGCGESCGTCAEGVCLASGLCGGCTPGEMVCSGRDIRVCAEGGLTTDLVRRCDAAPFDDRCVRCPRTGEAACAAASPVCQGALTGVAGELSISADATCGDVGCELAVLAGSQLSLTVAEVQLALTADLGRVPSGQPVPLNARAGGAAAPVRVSVRSDGGRCDNDFGQMVRQTPAPEPGSVTITRSGTAVGDPVRIELTGHLSCDGGASWQPLGVTLDLLVSSVGS